MAASEKSRITKDHVVNYTSTQSRIGMTLIAFIVILLSCSLGCISIDYPWEEDEDDEKEDFHGDYEPGGGEEPKDSDYDGIMDDTDEDDDNDGVPDENDDFPLDANESFDNDLDGIGDNADIDDDNDGINDTEDMDPYHDLALSFTFDWVNLSVPLNSRSTGWFYFDLYSEGERLKRFDNNGDLWKVPWETPFNLSVSFEMNIPDNITFHNYQVLGYHARWKSSDLLDIGHTNDSYIGNISMNLSMMELGSPVILIMDGSEDNGTDEPDAALSVSIKTYHFGYLKSYSWIYDGKSYQFSYNFDPREYTYYQKQDHKIRSYDDYVKYATPDDAILIDFTNSLMELVIDENLSVLESAQFILTFIQSLKYAEDNVTTGIGEYPRYPIETLVDQMGDCEDTSLLLISMAEILNIESALLLLTEAFDDVGHAAGGLAVNASGSFFESGELDYYYAETTGIGWTIGEVPEFNSTKAYIYEIP